MRIARISIKNFLGIVEAELAPKKINVLAGKNRQGKTSFTKGIEAAFKGMTPAMIHYGAERAELVIDLEDLVVTRVQTQQKSSVTVKTKEGFTRTAPQAFLNGMIGGFAFNPMAFLLADRNKRTDVLMKAMDCTVTAEQIREAAGGEDVPALPSGPALVQYNEAHGWFYRIRTENNRRLKVKKAAAAETRAKLPEKYVYNPNILVEIDKARAVELDATGKIAGLKEEQKAAVKAAETRTNIQARIEKNEGAVAAGKKYLSTEPMPDLAPIQARIEELERKLQEERDTLTVATQMRDRLMDLKEEVEYTEKLIVSDRETLAALPGEFDAARLTAEEARAADARAKVAALADERKHMGVFEEAAGLDDEVAKMEAESKRLDGMVELFGKTLPAKALAEAKLPITDLAIVGDTITVRGTPIDDLATSEQMGVTLSIARALAGELPVICIDGYERLDEDSQAEFIRQGENDGFYYFVTLVGTPGKECWSCEGTGKIADAPCAVCNGRGRILREGEVEIAAGKVVA